MLGLFFFLTTFFTGKSIADSRREALYPGLGDDDSIG